MRRKGFGRLADLPGQVWLLSPAQELKLSQHPATQVTLAVELNPCLGQRGSFCSPVKYSAFPKSHLLTRFVLITSKVDHQVPHFSPFPAHTLGRVSLQE